MENKRLSLTWVRTPGIQRKRQIFTYLFAEFLHTTEMYEFNLDLALFIVLEVPVSHPVISWENPGI